MQPHSLSTGRLATKALMLEEEEIKTALIDKISECFGSQVFNKQTIIMITLDCVQMVS
jgi:hypothetical protein